MAKIPYSKLKCKTDTSVSELKYLIGEDTYNIEIRNYLPVDEKLELIGKVISMAADDNRFYNVGKLDILLDLYIIYYYTNLSFTEGAKDNVTKLYDELTSSGLKTKILDVIDSSEKEWLRKTLNDTVKSIYEYQNSIFGIITTLTTDYSNIGLELTDLQEKISNPENMKLLKDVLTKLG